MLGLWKNKDASDFKGRTFGKRQRRSAVEGSFRAPSVSQPREFFYRYDPGLLTPCVTLSIGAYWLPAVLDSGSSLSFIRQDVLHNFEELGLPCTLQRVQERCVMANGEPYVIAETAVLGIKIGSFSWKWRFSILRKGPIPCILGVDFMSHAKLKLDSVARKFRFGFCPEERF